MNDNIYWRRGFDQTIQVVYQMKPHEQQWRSGGAHFSLFRNPEHAEKGEQKDTRKWNNEPCMEKSLSYTDASQPNSPCSNWSSGVKQGSDTPPHSPLPQQSNATVVETLLALQCEEEEEEKEEMMRAKRQFLGSSKETEQSADAEKRK